MDLLNIAYVKETGDFMMDIHVHHAIHGTVNFSATMNIYSQYKSINLSRFQLERTIPIQDHILLLEELRVSKDLKSFIYEQAHLHLQKHSPVQHELFNIISLHILRTEVIENREVIRKGTDLRQIEEKIQKEYHIRLAVQFDGIKEIIQMNLIYDVFPLFALQSAYRLIIKRTDVPLVSNHLPYDWEEYVLSQLLPLVRERLSHPLP